MLHLFSISTLKQETVRLFYLDYNEIFTILAVGSVKSIDAFTSVSSISSSSAGCTILTRDPGAGIH